MSQPASLATTASPVQINWVVNLTPSSVTGSAFSSQTFTITGLQVVAHQFAFLGQQAWASGAFSQTAGVVVVDAYVSAANTLTVLFYNTGSTGTPAAGYYSLIVL